MPLSDGTNDEKEDVSPPLEWKTQEDVRDVVLHQMHGSPPCVKIRLLLQYYNVPFTTAKGKKKGSAYTKVPVMTASGRQINDSYIIFKNLVPVLCGQPFDQEWQDKITYQLQLSIEAEAFADHKGDLSKLASKAFGIPACIACCIAGPMGRKIGKKIRAKNPNLPPSVEVGKAFAATMGANKFFGGEQPGQVDIAYYGTLLVFKWAGCESAEAHLSNAGLAEWWMRMEAAMPDAMAKK
jgi:glutathione S-transferase